MEKGKLMKSVVEYGTNDCESGVSGGGVAVAIDFETVS
jgi:hypothetical protein